jgi:pimeloyl-ACP methyl ester carboxylesterase
MPTVTLPNAVSVHFEDQYFGAPWVEPEVIVLVHGIAESSQAWVQWVPILSRHFRVIRPDLPGFGASPVPPGYSWSPHEIAADLVGVMGSLGIPAFHLVGAKYGGTISMQLAADHPECVRTLCIFSSPIRRDLQDRAAVVQDLGVEEWAKRSQRERLGSAASDAQIAWWTDELMAGANPIATSGAGSALRNTDLTDQLSLILAPSLIVTTEYSARQSVEVVREYQSRIANSRLTVLPGDAYHPAAVEPERCANMVLDFVSSLSGDDDRLVGD